MQLRWVIGLTIIATVVSGCRGELEERVREHEVRMETLSRQIAQLEKDNEALRAALAERPEVPEAPAAASAGNRVVNVTPEIIASLAEQINDLVLARLASTVDQRIAAQVGTADDIEAIFSEVVVDEINAREEAERREREEQRLQQAAERDTRGVERRLDSLEIGEERREQVLAARQAMRDRLGVKLAGLREQGASAAELMAAVAEERVNYEVTVGEILGEEDMQSYVWANRWVQRDQERLEELNEQLKLEADQIDALVDAYAERRGTLSDGFYLARRGYLGRDDMREGFEQTREVLQSTMRDVLTEEQYTAYDESDLSRDGFFGRGRGGRGR